jgi:Putative MetA-pathway of phenol degradation
MRCAIVGCFIGILMLIPTSVWAVYPFQVEDTNTQGKGNFLFELNGNYEKLKNGDNTATDLSGVFTAGTGDHTDIILEVPYLLLDQSPDVGLYERGVGDVQLKLKYRINENEVNQSSGIEIYSGLPTGDANNGLGTGTTLLGIQVMDQQGCCNNIYHVSAAYEIAGADLKKGHYAQNYTFRFGLALEHKITEPFYFLAELAGDFAKTQDKVLGTQTYTKPYTLMAGFKYDISRTWYIDISVRAGLTKDAEEYTTLTGTAWRF